MAVSYRKLRELLLIRKIQHQKLMKDLSLGGDTVSKINKDVYMSLQTIEKICEYLNVNIEDILEFKK